MKLKFTLLSLIASLFFAGTAFAQEQKKDTDITVSESVLKVATWANFKYMEQLELAKNGDHKATLKLLEFSGTVDGRDALDHAVTLLELLKVGGDVTFAGAVNMAKPKLKTVLLQRLQLAQGRTQKEELRKPIAEWAPVTWDVLNGKPFAPSPKEGEEKSCLESKNYDQKAKAAMGAGSNGGQSDNFNAATPAENAEKPKGKQ